MYRYRLYIMKHMALATLTVVLSLTSIVWLTQALRFIDFIVNRGISFFTFLHLTLLLIPSLLLLLLPASLLIATLFVYHRLMADSELVILRSAGLSNMQIALPGLQIAAVVTLFAYVIGFYLLPVSHSQFKDMQVFLRDNYASLLLQEEVFNNPVDNLTVFIRERDPNGVLHGILVHDSRNPNAAVTMMAQEGQLAQTPQGPRFLLINGNRQEMRNGKLSLLNFDSYTLDISVYTNKADSRTLEPEEFFMPDLFSPPEGLPEKLYPALRVELHQRLTWPFFNLTIAAIAVSMLLTGDFNRRGQWTRVGLASITAFGVMMLGISLINYIQKHPWGVPMPYLNAVGFFAFALLLLWRRDLKNPERRQLVTLNTMQGA